MKFSIARNVMLNKIKYVLMYEKFLANPEGELRNLFKVRKIIKD